MRRTITGPISPVPRTCVPPHALRSIPSISTTRISPVRSAAFRRPVADAASSNVTVTGRFSNTISLARRSAFSARSFGSEATSRSSVEDSSPKCTLTVLCPKSSSNTAESRCWPVCCCMWSNRRVQSTRALSSSLGEKRAGFSRTCAIRSFSSTTSTTRASPSVPTSKSWPPDVG